MPAKEPGVRVGGAMLVAGFVLTGALLTWLFTDWQQRRAARMALPTSVVLEEGGTAVRLRRGADGHYLAHGMINEQPVLFMLDTGASSVAIPDHVARSLGLRRGAEMTISTANGLSSAHHTRIERVRLGAIELHDIAGVIAPRMEGDAVLLGMSFLRRVDFSQQGNFLILQLPAGGEQAVN